jgi:predicted nucleic acid-binding protein
VLVDTNVIIRSLQPESPDHHHAQSALKTLKAQGHDLSLAPQNLVEIWAVATRPPANNGLGFTTEEAAAEITRLGEVFTILSEKPVHDVWQSLVIEHHVSGKATHDARLVAAMQVHGLNAILTFNTEDFKRYPGIEVVHPADVAAPNQQP